MKPTYEGLNLYLVEFRLPREIDTEDDPHDTYWSRFWAEDEGHAREQAEDAVKDTRDRVLSVERAPSDMENAERENGSCSRPT